MSFKLGLGVEDFENLESAYKAADLIIKESHDTYPEKVQERPNKTYEGFPQLDQFCLCVKVASNLDLASVGGSPRCKTYWIAGMQQKSEANDIEDIRQWEE